MVRFMMGIFQVYYICVLKLCQIEIIYRSDEFQIEKNNDICDVRYYQVNPQIIYK